MRESVVEKHLVRLCESRGWKCLKFDPSRCVGMPDRLLLLPLGRTVWVELKTDGGRLSAVQTFRHVELAKLGHRVFTVWSIEQANELVGRLETELTEFGMTESPMTESEKKETAE